MNARDSVCARRRRTAPRARRRIARRASVTDGRSLRRAARDEARAFPSETLQRERDDRAEEWHDGARDDHGYARDLNTNAPTRCARWKTRAREKRRVRGCRRRRWRGGRSRVGRERRARGWDAAGTNSRRLAAARRDEFDATRAIDARDVRVTDDGVSLSVTFRRAQAWT